MPGLKIVNSVCLSFQNHFLQTVGPLYSRSRYALGLILFRLHKGKPEMLEEGEETLVGLEEILGLETEENRQRVAQEAPAKDVAAKEE